MSDENVKFKDKVKPGLPYYLTIFEELFKLWKKVVATIKILLNAESDSPTSPIGKVDASF